MLSMSTSRRPGARRPYHHADLKPALLAAARRVLEREGPDRLSLRELARRAGVSHNAPYRHFRDRTALLAALAAEGFEQLTARMRAAAAGAPAARRLDAIGAAYVRFALDEPGLFRLMFGGRLAVKDHPDLAAAAERAYAVLAGETGAAGTPAPRAIAAWATVHGLAHLLLDGQIASASGDRDAAERLLNAIFGAGGA
jgi:AcrR family transcriptional regulator